MTTSAASDQVDALPTRAVPDDDLRTFVTLTRNDPRDIGQRQVVARIDDGEPITLLFGDSVTVETQPGSHKLKTHNTLVRKSVPFAVESGEHVEFWIVNRASKLALGFLALIGVAPVYLTVERRPAAPAIRSADPRP
jgi:hypothetical protein